MATVRWRDLGLERVVRKMEVGIGEEQERSRLGELAEEVMQKELRAQRQELDDIERAGYAFEGTRLEVVADEVFFASFFASLKNRILFSIFNLGSRAGHRKILRISQKPAPISLIQSMAQSEQLWVSVVLG